MAWRSAHRHIMGGKRRSSLGNDVPGNLVEVRWLFLQAGVPTAATIHYNKYRDSDRLSLIQSDSPARLSITKKQAWLLGGSANMTMVVVTNVFIQTGRACSSSSTCWHSRNRSILPLLCLCSYTRSCFRGGWSTSITVQAMGTSHTLLCPGNDMLR